MEHNLSNNCELIKLSNWTTEQRRIKNSINGEIVRYMCVPGTWFFLSFLSIGILTLFHFSKEDLVPSDVLTKMVKELNKSEENVRFRYFELVKDYFAEQSIRLVGKGDHWPLPTVAGKEGWWWLFGVCLSFDESTLCGGRARWLSDLMGKSHSGRPYTENLHQWMCFVRTRIDQVSHFTLPVSFQRSCMTHDRKWEFCSERLEPAANSVWCSTRDFILSWPPIIEES